MNKKYLFILAIFAVLLIVAGCDNDDDLGDEINEELDEAGDEIDSFKQEIKETDPELSESKLNFYL